MEGEASVLAEEAEEFVEVSGEHLGGVEGDGAGEVEGGEERDAVEGLGLAGDGVFAVAAGFGGKVYDYAAGFHPA